MDNSIKTRVNYNKKRERDITKKEIRKMKRKKNPTNLNELMKAMQKPKKKGKIRKWNYPTELVGLSGWAEMIEAIKKRRRDKNG